MDETGNFNMNDCQVILVTSEDWTDGMPLGECNRHTMMYISFKNKYIPGDVSV